MPVYWICVNIRADDDSSTIQDRKIDDMIFVKNDRMI